MILIIFGILTCIEALIILIKISKISEHYEYAKFDRFFLRLYNNYKDLIWVFIVVILFLNLILSVVICAIIYAATLLITL